MSEGTKAEMGWEGALEKLLAGNKRYVDWRQEHPNQTPERRQEVESGQDPFAVILGCSDSRVPPEVIFDQGIGDLFVVRVAGNVVDNLALGSIEYAVSHLRTPLVVVLAHSDCGAVTATLSTDQKLPGQLGFLTAAIQPAVELAGDQPDDRVNIVSRQNAGLVAERLRHAEPILSDAVRNGRLRVAAAYYHLSSGVVEILSR